MLSQSFFNALHDLGRRAPVVLLLDGGDHSYWHNRADGDWGSMVLDEAIPRHGRVAIGGISMGGYGALLLGSHYSAPVWIEVGAADPFHDAAVHYAREIHAQLHVWPGGHDSGYWHSHLRQYLAFYAAHCA